MSYIRGYKEDFKKWFKKCQDHTFKLANKKIRSQLTQKGFYLRPTNYPHHKIY